MPDKAPLYSIVSNDPMVALSEHRGRDVVLELRGEPEGLRCVISISPPPRAAPAGSMTADLYTSREAGFQAGIAEAMRQIERDEMRLCGACRALDGALRDTEPHPDLVQANGRAAVNGQTTAELFECRACGASMLRPVDPSRRWAIGVAWTR